MMSLGASMDDDISESLLSSLVESTEAEDPWWSGRPIDPSGDDDEKELESDEEIAVEEGTDSIR